MLAQVLAPEVRRLILHKAGGHHGNLSLLCRVPPARAVVSRCNPSRLNRFHLATDYRSNVLLQLDRGIFDRPPQGRPRLSFRMTSPIIRSQDHLLCFITCLSSRLLLYPCLAVLIPEVFVALRVRLVNGNITRHAVIEWANPLVRIICHQLQLASSELRLDRQTR